MNFTRLRGSDTRLVASTVYDWLSERDDTTIPRSSEIGEILGQRLPWTPDAHRVREALLWLRSHKMIEFRHGKISQGRGHMIIRMVHQGGRTFRTEGCPFELTAAYR
jgi:hypothetical protein